MDTGMNGAENFMSTSIIPRPVTGGKPPPGQNWRENGGEVFLEF